MLEMLAWSQNKLEGIASNSAVVDVVYDAHVEVFV